MTAFHSYMLDQRGCLSPPLERQPRRHLLAKDKPQTPAERKESKKSLSLTTIEFVTLEIEGENDSGATEGAADVGDPDNDF